MATEFISPPPLNIKQLLQPAVHGTPATDLPYPGVAPSPDFAAAQPGQPIQPQAGGAPAPAQPQAPAMLQAPPQPPPEAANYTAQLAKLNQPPSLKELVAKAALSFAPTAIAGAVGGLPAAAGAAQGTQAGLTAEQATQDQQKKSLLQQVEAARGREERMAERQLTTQERASEAALRQKEIEGTNASRLEGLKQTNQTRTDIQDLKNTIAQQGLTQKGGALDAQMLRSGFTKDETGAYVATPEKKARDEAELNYKNALTDHQKALAEVERTKNDPNSPAYKLALAKAQQTSGNLEMRQREFELRAFGTVGGVQPPGGLQTDSGQPVGTAFQQNVLPTAATRTKAQTASPFMTQAEDLKAYALDPKNADIFGKIGGRWTELMGGKIGTDDERISRLIPKIRSLASLAAPLHGFRGSNVVEDFTKSMPVVDSPQAFAAAVDEYAKTGSTIQRLGTPKTKGGAGSPSGQYGPAETRTLKSGGTVKVHKNLQTGKYEEF